MEKIKNIRYKVKRKLGLASPSDMLEYYRNLGIKIGHGTVAFSTNIIIDTQRPWMLEIGEYCKITDGVVLLQHDYSRSVLRRVYGEIIGESKKTIIGNNVFIGINSIILMGTHIGDNVIVGAGSVVSGEVPSNVVVAGNPARIVRSLDEHYSIRKKKYVLEAMETAKEFKRVYHRNPSIEEIGSFWPLFLPRKESELKKNNIFTKLSGDEEEDVIRGWLGTEALYPSFEGFLRDCGLL